MKEEATASNLRGKLITDSGKLHVEIAYAMIMSEIGRREAAEKQVESLSAQVENYKGLELSYHTEIEQKSLELESLSKQLEGLKRTSEAKDREIEGLKQTIDELSGKLNESESARSNMSLSLMTVESKLSDKDAEAEQLKAELEKVHAAWQELYMQQGNHTAEVAYYKQKAKEAKEESEGLREELERLKAQQQQLSNDNDSVGAKGFIKKLSKSDEDKIVSYYLAHSKRLTKAGLERFILETGIEISDNGFRDVLKRRGVYKRAKHRVKRH